MRSKKISARLGLLAVAFCSAFAGCAIHGRGPYVIAGMDYGGVESALRTKDGARIYIMDVKRAAGRDMLVVRYTHLGEDKSEWIAHIDKHGITITPITQTSTIEQGDSKEGLGEISSVMKLPWVGNCYDVHPETGRLLLGENRNFMPRYYEYDVATNSRKKLGFAREWVFYLRRDFANSKPLSSFVTTKEPSAFR